MIQNRFAIGIWGAAAFAFLLACSGSREEGYIGSGTMEATEVTISSKVAGEIVGLKVEEGDVLNEGDMVAQVDTEKIALQLQQLLSARDELKLNIQNGKRSVDLAVDNYDNVLKKFDRTKALLEEGSVTQQQFDDIETALKSAETTKENAQSSLLALDAKEKQLSFQIQLAQSQMSDAQITAPLGGTVVEKYIEQGEVVRPGSPVIKMADLQEMWIKIYIGERDLGAYTIGEPVVLRPSRQDAAVEGRMVWFSPVAEFTPKNVQTKEARADLVYAAKIAVHNPDGVLKIGMPVDVYEK
jgi:HlyD family secretion protein